MLIDEVVKNLDEVIIPFWKKMRDDEYGGFYGKVDSQLKLYKKTSKACVYNSRIMWFFLQAYKYNQDKECLDCANQAYRLLKNNYLDQRGGGLYWSVSYDLIPDDTAKYTFNLAYAILALTAYYETVGDDEALKLAIKLRDIIEVECKDDYGYLEIMGHCSSDDSSFALAEGDYRGEKTANTVLHLLEAYSELYRVKPGKTTESCIEYLMQIYTEKIYNPKKKHINMFFDSKMEPIADYYSFGHDIESSWILDKCCDIVPKNDYTDKVRKISDELIENIYLNSYSNNSIDDEISDKTVNDRRVFWVQAEAVVGFINAWEKHPEKMEYYDAAMNIWGFIRDNIVDKRPGGEWLHDVSSEGKQDSESSIVGPWKCPFHNGRMCMELIRRNKEGSFTEKVGQENV